MKHELGAGASKQEIADGVDASATADHAQFESGLHGFEAHLYRSLPRVAVAATTGSGSVSPGGTGTEVNPGATAGDTAILDSANYQPDINMNVSFERAILQYQFTPLVGTFSDIARVGFDNEIHLDLTNEQFVNGANTVAVSIPKQNESALLTLNIDFANGETSFALDSKGSYQTATLQGASTGQESRVYTESNGTGEGVLVHWLRERWVSHD